MLRRMLTPRWILVHLLFLAATVVTVLLAAWQWDRAHAAGGSFQNLGYALQWPLFGAFTLFFWWRVIRLFGFGDGPEQQAVAASASSAQARAAPAEEAPAERARSAAGVGSTGRRRRPLVPPPASPVDPDEDPELAAYNQYLRELNEQDGRDGGHRT
ncbi:hypothetical protein [Salinifilum ghardaiensis]